MLQRAKFCPDFNLLRWGVTITHGEAAAKLVFPISPSLQAPLRHQPLDIQSSWSYSSLLLCKQEHREVPELPGDRADFHVP